MPAKCQASASQAWFICVLLITSASLPVTSYMQSSQTSLATPFNESRFFLESAPQSLHRVSRVSSSSVTASLVIRSGTPYGADAFLSSFKQLVRDIARIGPATCLSVVFDCFGKSDRVG